MPKPLAVRLRQDMTDAEMRLWFRLRPMRALGLAFRRQSPIGRFIADFACRPARLIVEVDGSQHAEAIAYDCARTSWLEDRGWRMLRYWNADVLQATDAVVDEIVRIAQNRLNRPPPAGEVSGKA